MHLQLRPALVPLVLGALLTSALVYMGWRRRSLPAVRPYVWLAFLVWTWCLAYVAELASSQADVAVIWAKAQYVAIATVPLAWLAFTVDYAGRRHLLPRRRLLLLGLVPALTILLAWTNERHGLLWTAVSADELGGHLTLRFGRGPWFWLHTAYSYLLLLVGGTVLLQVLHSSVGLQRKQAAVLLAAMLVPWATNVLVVTGMTPWPGLDLTPFGFVVGGVGVLWALVRYRLLDIMPVAHATVIAAMADAMVVLDAHDRVLDLNPVAARLLSVGRAAAIGRSSRSVFAEMPGVLRSLERGDEAHCEVQVGEGAARQHLDVRISPLNGGRESAAGRVVIIRDLTDHRRTEEALHESERRYRTIFETAADLILVVDRRGCVADCNGRIAEVVGYTRQELLGRPARELLPPEDLDAARASLEEVRRGGAPYAHRRRLLRKGGRRVDVRVNSSVVYDAYERPEYTVHIVQDITEQLRLEAQYHHTQKMQAIGRLAGGIAHDFNNLLTIINGCADLLQESLPPECEAAEDLEEILLAGRRAADLTEQLLAFSRRQPDAVRSLAVNDALVGMARILRRIIGEPIELQLDLDPEAGCIRADPGRIEQVVVNLAVNARDAVPSGGLLRLATARVSDGEAWPPGISPGGTDLVRLEVQDTGTGIAPDIMERIFEPFFTTKPPGEGTGLGLATVYAIVTGLGGSVHVGSSPGVGTTFRIYFPREADPRPPADVPRAPALARGGEEHVLLVEDEPGVRRYVASALRRLGYTVTEAADGAAALELCTERAESYDLILTDIVMPGMSGHDLLERLASIGRLRRALCMTGYADEALERDLAPHVAGPPLRKPFGTADLSERVRAALDG